MSDHPTPRPARRRAPVRRAGTSAPTRRRRPRCWPRWASRSLDDLMQAAVPGGIRLARPARPARRRLGGGGARASCGRSPRENVPREPMIGLGYHGTITPPVVRRNVLEDPSWYTAYTPYQPEISQGRLEALLNFQTMVGDLTGLPTANASLLDEGTAAAEAMTLVRRGNRSADGPFVVDANALPQTIAVVETRARAMGIEVVVADLAGGLPEGPLCGVLVQYPGADGAVARPAPAGRGRPRARRDGRGRRRPAGAHPAGVARLDWAPTWSSGSTQRFGVPLFYGGPHAGYMAVRSGLERHLPGRLVGVSVDADGRPAYRLALQTREQHIRRDKATSNICTAQVLLAVVASMYAVYHGPDGLRAIAHADPPLRRGHRRRAARGRRGRAARAVLRHRHRRGARAGPPRSSRGPRARGAPAAGRRGHRRGVHLRVDPARARARRCWPRSASPAPTSTRSTPGSATSSPPGCAARRRTSPTRCSAPTTPRPRCCATCAGSRHATTRSTAA